MLPVRVRFHAQLNDFLPEVRRNAPIELPLKRRASVKDVIEAQGVPHPEVGLILANGTSVDFSYIVRDGDQISVYPSFTRMHMDGIAPQDTPEPRFVLDSHLGRLAGHLRMLGFDTLYRNDYEDRTLACISADEGRILLTRDRGLLKRSIVTQGYYVRGTDHERQVAEVVARFDLRGQIRPFLRCLRCNGLLVPASKEEILDRLEPLTREHFHEFRICSGCDWIYWKGSHHKRMEVLIGRLFQGEGWD